MTLLLFLIVCDEGSPSPGEAFKHLHGFRLCTCAGVENNITGCETRL